MSIHAVHGLTVRLSLLLATILAALPACKDGKDDAKPKAAAVPPPADPSTPATAGTVGVEAGDDNVDDKKKVVDDKKKLTPGPSGLIVSDASTLVTSVVTVGTLALEVDGAALTEAIGQTGVVPGSDPAEDTLSSLKYYIQNIRICENAQNSPSQGNCLSVYDGSNIEDYDTFGYAEAKADTKNYIDLMDPESVAKLSKAIKLDSKAIGKYNYGYVQW